MRASRRPSAPAHGRAYARAALLGNPSDAFGGKTLGLAFAELSAEVSLGGGASMDADAKRLVGAAVARLGRATGAAVPADAAVSTDIPREVGLGGSSAIVIATVRAGCAAAGTKLEPSELAALALAVERDDLGIAAGPQDRLIQAHEGLLYMDFAEAPEGRCEQLDPALLPPLFVAWRRDGSAPSGAVHRELRRRWEEGDPRTCAALGEIAELAERGRECLVAGKSSELGELMRANVTARSRILELDPRHVRMVELAGELGCGANYAGSGGAIVGTLAVDTSIGDLRAAFAAEGCELTAVTPVAA